MSIIQYFKNKRKKEEVFIPIECNHTWKDFPWYIKGIYYTDIKMHSIEIYEPYVCIHCKKRKDVLLYSLETSCTEKEADKRLAEYWDKYKDNLEDRVIIEDMINDYINIDREKLEITEHLRNGTIKI